MRARTVNQQSKDDLSMGSLAIPKQDIGEIVDTWGDQGFFGVFPRPLFHHS